MEGLQDMRVLQLLEELTDRDTVIALMEDGLDTPVTFKQYPREASWLLSFFQGKMQPGNYQASFSEIKLAGGNGQEAVPLFGRGEKQPLPAAQDNTKLPGQR